MDPQAVAAIATLDDDVRRALFTCVRDASGPVTREAAAEAVGISRKLAAFHLDKLVAAGLLDARTETRTEAAGGRRVGRTPKVYEPSRRHLEVSLPQREHGLLAEVLISALASPEARAARDAAVTAARERGVREGAAVRERVRPGRLGVERATRLASDLLSEHGFEPVRTEGDDLLRLRNCPFHPLVESSPELVCGLNHAYLCGMLHGLGADGALDAVLAPEPGQCCVAFRRRESD